MNFESCCSRIWIVYIDLRILCLPFLCWLSTQIKNTSWTWPLRAFKCLNYRISIFVPSFLSAVSQISVKSWSYKILYCAFGLSLLTPQSVVKKARKVIKNTSHIYRSLNSVMFSVADRYYRDFFMLIENKYYYCHSVRISSCYSNMVCISSNFNSLSNVACVGFEAQHCSNPIGQHNMGEIKQAKAIIAGMLFQATGGFKYLLSVNFMCSTCMDSAGG